LHTRGTDRRRQRSPLRAKGARHSSPTMPRRPRFRVGAKGVIFRDNRVLLLRRRDDLALYPSLWDLPGGGLEEGESLEESLVREVHEETGFHVRVVRLVHAWAIRNTLRSGESFPGVIICFECRSTATRPPRLDPSEHSDFAWASQRALPTYDGLSDQFTEIRKAFLIVVCQDMLPVKLSGDLAALSGS
jgi:8-oxo-dGTP pyrophosphatase MutT (NUDIX family)